MNKTLKRAGIVAGTVGAIAAIATASFAFFTATGSVTANGTTGTTQSVTARDAVVSPALFPGSCSDVSFTLHNPNGVDSPGIREIAKFDFGSVDGAQNYLRAPYIESKNTPNSVLIANGYNMQPIPANGDRQVTLPNAICLTADAPDSVQGKAVTVNLDLVFKTNPGTEYTGS